ncbi:DUF3147 family protein [Vampirovibrio sp.]|uniref:DUF3147 family protein n=1 Tax=Vampirovibrio sp. TaxID=2717857 RepID=UPI0035941C61
MQYLIKTSLSALIIVAVSEVSKRNSWLGALLASLPLVSVLALIWLYSDTKSIEKVASLSTSIFWMVIPSLSLFLLLPILLKKHIPFYLALTVSCLITSLIYYLASLIYGKLGIKL